MKRRAMGSKESKRLFTRTASRRHRKNGQQSANPMRGGFRL